ncbi:nitrogen fixation protein NifM [Oceanobacter sp. 4_MG-2023]|uniref:nitrogen fixation protein NifM n=1 Tax=Oceanobacter sp. 4_MG-2023 TaxID=3062623 RepID=UPI002735A2A4|nr:nitrogen fixation protein NifM [Oceanobacter sp. 4_MG-2023]MDP2549117.1 nitrogen fixation protein NifM [Oceanobacter sp. 4_MG-2023]
MSALARSVEHEDRPLNGYRELRIAGEQFGCSPHELTPEQARKLQRIASNELALEQLILSSPESAQVSVPTSQLDAALDQIRQRYESDAQFEEALEHNGLGTDDLRDGLLRELTVEAVMELVGSRGVHVDATEATLFYYLHPERFAKPEIRTARHILITVNEGFAENERNAAYQRLEEITRRVKRSPKRFAEQALKHSECPTSLNGGLLGEVRAGTLFPELDKALFSMSEDELRGPIESELGWHLLWCEKIHPATLMPLDEVLPRLQEELQQRQNKRTQKLWLKQRAASV